MATLLKFKFSFLSAIAANSKTFCLEEIAFDKKYITREQLWELATPLSKNEYGEYLMKIVETASKTKF